MYQLSCQFMVIALEGGQGLHEQLSMLLFFATLIKENKNCFVTNYNVALRPTKMHLKCRSILLEEDAYPYITDIEDGKGGVIPS
jgi:hypothetical protein